MTNIGEFAFSSCNEKLYIKSNGVVYVDSWVVDVVDNAIISVNIKSGTRGIADDAFSWCNSLTSVEIPNSVISIGEEAFESCSRLMSIEIPNSVTSIGDRAFSYCSSLTSVKIPSSVASIGEFAFYACSSLTSFTFNGTIAQWKDVKKGLSWLIGSKVTNIICSDGEVAV